MKVLNILILALTISQLGYSQDWIDKKFTYSVERDITYGVATNYYGGTDTLKLDLFRPDCNEVGVNQYKPLLIWVHGGSFNSGSKDDPSIQEYCKSFAERGYITASVSYRLGFVTDDSAWSCNFPGYACGFATDHNEWIRAGYRGVQDVKGAIRYLVNRNSLYSIDTNNIFLAGESAGAFAALGAALLDHDDEKPAAAFQLADVNPPHANAATCQANVGVNYPSSIARPDLGDINGSIESNTNIKYQIKGVGNFYGGLFSDLLAKNSGNNKPAIYSYHRPCDVVVPIDSNYVYWGISWCFTNGYNCYGFKNVPMVYGSRILSNWNSNRGYGYQVMDDFTNDAFPYDFFATYGCLDQVTNPCHGVDNRPLREGNLAKFFANLITTPKFCTTINIADQNQKSGITIYPNPSKGLFTIDFNKNISGKLALFNNLGQKVLDYSLENANKFDLNIQNFNTGLYWLKISSDENQAIHKIIKE